MTQTNRLHTLLQIDSLNELISEAGKFLSNPVILGDLSLHVLAISQDENITDPRWLEIKRENTIPLNLINVDHYRNSLLSSAPTINTDSTGLLIVRCAVSQSGHMIGYLLSPCYHGSPSGEELDFLQLLSDLCSLKMQKMLHITEYPEDTSAYFISDLINGIITDEQKIRDRCSYFGWTLELPYRVLSIRSQNENEMQSGDGYLAQTRRCELLQNHFPDATVFLYGEQIKLIIGTRDESTQERLILQEVNELLSANGLIAGVSQAGRNFRSLAARHRQAMKAIQMGTLLHGQGPLFYYERYSIYHALELCRPGIDLRELCHSAVLELERYDRTNGSALMGTLHAYLSSGKNSSEAASALYIHRNTLTKRLDKIKDLIHVDLDDRETVFHLLFSFRVLEYYGATEVRSSFEEWVTTMPTLRHL